MFGRLAHLMYRRRWTVVAVWVVLLVAGTTGASQVGSVLGPGDFTQKGTDSAKAAALLSSKFHQNDSGVTLVVAHSATSTVHDTQFRERVDAMVGRIQKDTGLRIGFVDNPLTTGDAQLISRDRHSVAILISSKLKEETLEGQIDHLRDVVRTPGFTTYVTGSAATNHDNAIQSKKDLALGEEISVPILLVILLVVFGTLVAATLPLILAGISIALTLGVVYVFGHFIDTSVYVTNVATTLGLGIGIDYSLFIMYRFREELEAAGGNIESAIVRTMETTGRSVFFAGLTVATGLGALILTGIPFMVSMGLGGVLVPVTSLLVAMTLLPAILSLLGPGVNRFRVVPARFLSTGGGGAWHSVATTIMRRPLISGGLVLVIMLGLTYPVTQLQIANGGLKNEPKSMESVAGIRAMQADFPSAPNPTQVVLHAPPGVLTQPATLAAMRTLEAQIRLDPEASNVTGLADILASPKTAHDARAVNQYLSADRTTAIINVTAKDDIGTTPAANLVHRVRTLAASATSGDLHRVTINVGGAAAEFADFDDTLYGKFPTIVAIVLVLTYAFLFYAFRSAFLPLKAVLLNLLSVGASYGMLQLVFQRGVGAGLLNFSPESGVAGWVPIFLFAFLFGLSMDYEVFLLSRIRERWLETRDNHDAVAFGLEKTGRLISSAAGVMVIAFGAFLVGTQVQLKELGFGLMASIAIDASLIRIVLVPAIMAVMGEWNWWVPSFLRDFASRGSGFSEGEAVPHATPMRVPDEAGA